MWNVSITGKAITAKATTEAATDMKAAAEITAVTDPILKDMG